MELPRIPFYDVKGCVFKLFWGEKYVIIKGHYFPRAKTLVETNLNYYFKTGHYDKMYHKLFECIKHNPLHQFEVDFIIKNDSPYQLLKAEQIELEKSSDDPNCLNTTFEAYIPIGIQGKRKAWINRGHYLNFMMWRKKRNG